VIRRKKVLKLREIIPQLIRKYRTFSPIEIREKIPQDYNRAVTPEAITMFFERHLEVETELRKEVVSRELENEVVEGSIFNNGAFEELPSVKQCIIDKTGQRAQSNLLHFTILPILPKSRPRFKIVTKRSCIKFLVARAILFLWVVLVFLWKGRWLWLPR
jgi:hypothetical protein